MVEKLYKSKSKFPQVLFLSEMLDGMIERVGDFSQAFPRKRICTPEQMDSTFYS
ncbi:MAG: hypothetical protein Ct9H90mP7_1640 [Candidatus Neomarinimicrobiota bacterium]|nr:MAG: hypothetical protein Ct9H90mP7_1640 [Candidatus Neomarinimicrobiota bacterium]